MLINVDSSYILPLTCIDCHADFGDLPTMGWLLKSPKAWLALPKSDISL